MATNISSLATAFLNNVALNPQPLPPYAAVDRIPHPVPPDPQPLPPGLTEFLNSQFAPGSLVSLNPQPLPPRQSAGFDSRFAPGSAVSLNPQPLPPRQDVAADSVFAPGSLVALNPQPLPPRAATTPNLAGQDLNIMLSLQGLRKMFV